jgi:recombinational DNA repair protein RecR
MNRTGVICPVCNNKTDQSPCEICGYKFPNAWEGEEEDVQMH